MAPRLGVFAMLREKMQRSSHYFNMLRFAYMLGRPLGVRP